MRILYLEDNPNDAESTLRAFKLHDPKGGLITAGNIDTALKIIQSHPVDYFDIFLSTYKLTDGNAIQFLETIHQRGLFQPLVVLSEDDDPQDRKRILAKGVAGYINKKGDYQETLPAKIKKIHTSHRKNRKRQPFIRVLYAEHNPVDAELTQLHFVSHAANIVLQVISSTAELEKLCQPGGKNLDYDVIVLDTDIQQQGDLSLLKKLKAEWKIEQPVILLTAPGEDRLTVQALQMGVDNCVVKNIGYFQLLPAIIEVAFTKSRLLREQKNSLDRERLFRLMTENARDIVFRLHFSPDFGFDYISAAVKRLTGYSPEEFYENPSFLMELVDPEDFARLQQMLANPTRFGKPILLRWHARDGRLLWVEAKGSFIHGPRGEILALEGIARDITERIRFESALQEENERRQELETIINKGPVIVVRWKPKVHQPLDYISANISNLGYKAKDFLDGKILYEDIVHPDDVKQLESEVSHHAQAQDMQYRMRYRLVTKKGEIRWVDDLTWVVKDEQGTPLYHQGIVTDISLQKKVEEEEQRRTQRSQNERQSIIQLALDPAVSSGDFDVAIQHLNENVARVLGVERVSIWMYTEGEDGILCEDLYERSKNHHSRGQILQARDYPTFFESLRAGRAIAAQDARSDPRTFEFTEGYLQPLGIASLLDSAIRVRSQMVGVVCFEHIGELRHWHQDEITFCGEVADQVAQVILNLERRNAEEATRANEVKFRNIIEQSAEGFVLLDEDGFVIDWNRSTEKLFGISRDQALGQYFWDVLFQVVVPENRTKERYERLKKSIQVALLEDDSPLFAKPLEAEIFNLKGERISIQQVIFPLQISGKKFIASYTQDITDRKKAEQEIKESEKRFKALFEQANDAIFLMDGDCFIDCNLQTESIFGAKKDEIIGKTPFILSPPIQPDGRQSSAAGSKYIQAALSGKPQVFEWVHLHGDGTPFDAEVSLNRVEIGGKPFLQAMVRDISERKQSEKAIRESENRFRSIFEQANDGIFILDENKLVDCNQHVEMLFGWNRDEFLGKTPPDLSPQTQPDGRNSAQLGSEMYKLALQGQPQRFEWVHLRKDGTPFDVEVSLNRIEIRGKAMVQAIIRDITERKIADQSLKTAEKRYRGLFEDSPISLWEEDFSGVKQIIDRLKKRGVTDFHRYIQNHPEVVRESLDKVRIVDVNQATLRLFDVIQKEDLIKNLNQVLINDDLDSFAREIEIIASGIKEFHWEGINQTLSGRKIFIDMHWSAAPGFEDTLARVIVSIEDITARKQAELALVESETSYRTLAENLPGIVYRYYFHRPNGMQWFNSMMLPLTGYTDEEVVGFENWGQNLVLPEDNKQFRALVEKAIAKNQTFSGEYRIRKKDGEIRNFFERGQPVYDEKGKPFYVDGIILDVTERHQIETALHESEIRYRGLFEDSPVSLWEEDFSEVKKYIEGLKKKGIRNLRKYVTEHPGVILECAKKVKVLDLNRATIELYKAKNKNDLLRNVGKIFCDESLTGVVDEVLHIAEGVYDFEGETVNQTLDGQKINVFLHWAVAPGYEDTLSRVIISIIDITSQKKAEEAIRISEARYRGLVENQTAIISREDLDGNLTFVNEEFCKTFGKTREELIGSQGSVFILPEDRYLVSHNIVDATKPPYRTQSENRNITANGVRWYHWENSAILDAGGRVIEMQFVGLDITERRKAQEDLRISEERYRLIATNMTDVVFLMGLDLRFLYFSPSILGTSGYTVEEMLNKTLDKIMTAESFEKVTEIIGQKMTPENLADPFLPLSVEVELLLVKKDGAQYWGDVTGTLIRDEKGKPIMILGVAKDINTQKIAQIGLQRRDGILEAVSFAATHLLEAGEWRKQVPAILEKIGKALRVNRVYLIEFPYQQGSLDFSRLSDFVMEWTVPGAGVLHLDSQLETLANFQHVLARWFTSLSKGEMIVATHNTLPPKELAFFETLRTKGLVLTPIHVEGALWGMVGFEQGLDEHSWDATELEALRTFTDTFASAIQRQKAYANLLDRETRLHAILDASKDAILVALKGTTVYANTAFWHLFGLLPLEDLEDLAVESLISPIDRERYREITQTREKGNPAPSHYELKALKKNGSEFDLEVYVSTYELMGETYILALLRDITEKKQHDRELEALASVSTALRKARSREEMSPIIVDQLAKVMKAAGGLIMLEEPIQGDMVVQYSCGEFIGQEGLHVPEGRGISGEVKRTKKPYVSHDLLGEPLFFRAAGLTHCKEAVFYPMIAQKRVIGTLLVSRETPFDKTEIKVIGSIAEMSANAILRSELHEQTENRLQKLMALRQIDNAISSTLDLHQIIGIILTSSQKFLKVDAADILLYDEKSRKLTFAYGVGFRTNLMEGFSLNPGIGWAGEAAQTRKSIMIPDINLLSGEQINPTPPMEELVSYYVVPLITSNQVKGVMECFTRSPLRLDQDWEEFINLLADQAAIAIHSAQLFDEIKHSNLQLVRAYDETIEGWSRAMDIRDKETEGHTQRVVDLTLQLARTMGIPEGQLTHIKRGILLHDIGKLVVPDSILFKPSALTELEWKIMKMHPMNAFNMLSSVDYLKPALDIPYCHHEHWDGTGYPRGLKGEEIPLAARIFSVVDIWDALLSDRPYRPAWNREKTLAYIKSRSGEDLDPKVVKAFLKIISEPK